MSGKTQRALALAAVSVMALSLGMVAVTAEADQAGNTQTSNQSKAGFLKTPTGYIKAPTNQDKWKTDQIKNGTQSNQHKVQTPSPALNPQPEPPKPPTAH